MHFRIAEGKEANATFLAKACGVLAGVEVASRVFELVDSQVTVQWLVSDGQWVEPGMKLGQVIQTSTLITHFQCLSAYHFCSCISNWIILHGKEAFGSGF